MKTKKGLYNERYVEGNITLSIRAEVSNNTLEIPDKEAINLLQRELDYLSGSNTGSELLANANITLIKE
jgi:hypothetical protein